MRKLKLYFRKFVAFLFIGSMMLSSLFALTGCSVKEDTEKETQSPQKTIETMITAWKSKDEETFKSCFSNPEEVTLRYQFIDTNANGDDYLNKTSVKIQKELYQNFKYEYSDISIKNNNQNASTDFSIETIDMDYFLKKYMDTVHEEYDIQNTDSYLIKSKMNEDIYLHINDYIKTYKNTIRLELIYKNDQWLIYNGDELINILTGGYLGG